MRKMKDSGIEWIGEIPESWDVGKLGYFIQVFNGDRSSNYPSGNDLQEEGIPFLTSSNLEKDELTLDECKYITQEKYDSMGGFKMQINDIIYCLRGSVGKCSINLTEEQGTVASSLMGIRCTKIDPKFLLYILKSSVVDTQNALFINGTCAANLSAENVLEYRIPILDTKAQVDIVDYLDKKCAEIDAIIAAKEKTNELLKERRQSIIYEAVTKGLDPTVPMKDSGIEWIGKIPESWSFSKLKYDAYMKGRIGWQGLKADEFIEEGTYLVTGTDFEDGKVRWERSYHISEERFNEAPEIQLKEQDLLITKDGTIGKLAYIDYLPGLASLNSHLLVIRPKRERFLNKYLYWVLSSDVFVQYTEYAQDGTIMASLSQEKISQFVFGLPSIQEQQTIAKYLDEQCAEIDALISANESTIEKLKEYRQSVIYEAVTGKVEI